MYTKFNLEDFPFRTNKTQLAKILKVTRRTIHTYHDIAKLFIEDFVNDYPKYKGKPYFESPLTQYQCWVMWGIYNYIHLQKMPSKILEDQLENAVEFQYLFSRAKFDLLFPTYQDIENHEHQGLCKVA